MDRLRARWLLALALIVGGLIVGVLGAFAYSRTETTLYRAETALIAQSGSRPVTGDILRTIRDLVTTDIVAQNVIRNQHLEESSTQFYKRLRVTTVSSVIKVDVDDPSQDKAVRIAQEFSLVFTQLVRDRFGSVAGAVSVSIFDPAHTVGKVAPRVGAELGWGALFGALLGLLAANLLVLRGRRGVWLPVPIPYDDLPALEPVAPRQLPSPLRPALLGRVADSNGYAEIADALVARSTEDPFQTVLVVGDDGKVTAAIAETLANRGERTMWMQAADTNQKELDRLTAHCAFVLVASLAIDARLGQELDAVVAVTTTPDKIEDWPGVRLVGTIEK